MIIERLQHYSTMAFLIALVFVQGVIFVGTRAAISLREDLRVVFVNPELRTEMRIGAETVLQAMLAADTDKEFSQVYFTLADPETGEEISFEAGRQTDGTWLAYSAWDTSKFDPGYYELTANVNIYEGFSVESYKSSASPIYLAGDADELDQGGSDTSTSTGDGVTDPGGSDDTSTSTDDGTDTEGDEEDTTPAIEITVLSPESDQILTENALIDVQFNQELEPQTIVGVFIPVGEQISNVILDNNGDGKYSLTLDTLTYADGEYEWLFYIEEADAVTNLKSLNIVVDNSDVVHEPENRNINFGIADGTLEGDVFPANFSTNFVASQFTLELVNQNNPAIGTGAIDIPPSDGKSWVRSVELPSTFIDGSYDIIARAVEEETEEVVEKVFEIVFDLPEPISDLDFDNLELTLESPGSNLQGIAILRVTANQEGVTGFFVFTDTLDEEIQYVLTSAPVELQSIAAVDTLSIPDGNYKLHFEIRGEDETLATTDDIFVSVFNGGGSDDENSDENSNDSDEGENQDGNIDEESSVDVEIDDAELTDQEATTLFSGQFTCAELGLAENDECLKVLASINGNLDDICISQEILEPAACEDYLNRVFSDRECQDSNIIDAEECKDYLVEKYAGEVQCLLDDTGSCSTVIRDEYINRLAQKHKRKTNISSVLTDLHDQVLTVSEIKNVFGSALNDDSLPLASDEVKVKVVAAQDVVVLENEDVLTTRNNAVLILDQDADGLPDDVETFYGTSVTNPDTDGDGFLDGQEIANGYNPNGQGIFLNRPASIAPTLLDAIFGNGDVQQPTAYSPKINSSLVIEDISHGEEYVQLKGRASANTWVNIYIYSEVPLVAMTQSDEDGDWQYTLTEELNHGYHEIYIAQNSVDGNILIQSDKVVFQLAAAVEDENTSNTNNIDSGLPTLTDTEENTFSIGSLSFQTVIIYYVIGVVVIVLVVIGVIALIRRRSTHVEEPAEEVQFSPPPQKQPEPTPPATPQAPPAQPQTNTESDLKQAPPEDPII